jgi:hypothetical protein
MEHIRQKTVQREMIHILAKGVKTLQEPVYQPIDGLYICLQNRGILLSCDKQDNRDVCDFSPFADFASLIQHLATQHYAYFLKTSTRSCTVCETIFDCEKEGLLHRHACTMFLHTCHLCDKRFKTAKSLQLHCTIIHKTIQPKICELCDRQFAQPVINK